MNKRIEELETAPQGSSEEVESLKAELARLKENIAGLEALREGNIETQLKGYLKHRIGEFKEELEKLNSQKQDIDNDIAQINQNKKAFSRRTETLFYPDFESCSRNENPQDRQDQY